MGADHTTIIPLIFAQFQARRPVSARDLQPTYSPGGVSYAREPGLLDKVRSLHQLEVRK